MTISPHHRVTDLCTTLAKVKSVKLGKLGGRSFKIGDKYLSLNTIAEELKKFSKTPNTDPNHVLDVCFHIKRIHRLGEEKLKKHFFKWICTCLLKRLPNLFSNPKKAIIESPEEAAEKLCPAVIAETPPVIVPKTCPKPKKTEQGHAQKDLQIAAFEDRLKKIDKETISFSSYDLALKPLEKTKKSDNIDALDCVRNAAFFTVRKSIDKTIDFALLLDDQIKKLTNNKHSLINPGAKLAAFHNPFKFDLKKWKNALITLQDDLSIESAKHLIKLCHLDLLEALSEFNVDEAFFLGTPHHQKDACHETMFSQLSKRDFKNESAMKKIEKKRLKRRFLNQIKLPESVKGEPVSPVLKSIFERAKRTLKAEFIINNLNYCFFAPLEDRLKYFPENPDVSQPVYLQIRIFNLENPNWKDNYYYRNFKETRADHFEVGHLLELFSNEERIILPKQEGAEDMILRFCPRYLDNTFQKELLRLVLSNNPEKDFQGFLNTPELKEKLKKSTEMRKALLLKIEEKFGTQFYKKEVLAYTNSRRRH